MKPQLENVVPNESTRLLVPKATRPSTMAAEIMMTLSRIAVPRSATVAPFGGLMKPRSEMQGTMMFRSIAPSFLVNTSSIQPLMVSTMPMTMMASMVRVCSKSMNATCDSSGWGSGGSRQKAWGLGRLRMGARASVALVLGERRAKRPAIAP